MANYNDFVKVVDYNPTLEPVTLGELISFLSVLDEDALVPFDEADSYRGDYAKLAVSPGVDNAGDVLKRLFSVLNTNVPGYKGGHSTMHAGVDVYFADWGERGPSIVGLDIDRKGNAVITVVEHYFG